MTPSLFLFYAASALTLGGGMGVVATRNVVYAALSLLASLMGVAGIYLVLFAEFLALVQVLIYGGAIVIVVLFALMLTRLRELGGPMEHRQWPLALVGALGLFAVLAAAIARTGVPQGLERMGPPVAKVGASLFSQWAVPFEAASVLLLVALIGAIVLARPGGRD
ncbi:MAG: NADH-quinone oxidoreductase subunit J [Chloroflexi bacterium]|nr:NADH-quinone oxidoreductase subunit J [Chloroflexota bacterium]